MTTDRLLVPVSDSPTVRDTVTYAVSRALEDGPGELRFAFVHPPAEATDPDSERRQQAADEFLSKVESWAREDAGSYSNSLSIEVVHVGVKEYLFSPEDVARILHEQTIEHDIDSVVLDPEYDPDIGVPLLRPLKDELAEFDVPVDQPTPRQVRRVPLVNRTTAVSFGALFGVSWIFYQVLGGTFGLFDLITGTVSALIVAIGLSNISFAKNPTSQSPIRLLRMLPYIPYLGWEIFKSNLRVAGVILHPRLPIEPRLMRYRPAVRGSLPITTLANSITLTPGTLTIRVAKGRLLIHTLVPWARAGIREGSLERAVRFVFYGRSGMRIDSPEDREDTHTVDERRRGES